jgi:hypothetical protein
VEQVGCYLLLVTRLVWFCLAALPEARRGTSLLKMMVL